ncbi:hypothetical protein BU24DRAFT_423947 [Aaosphaeria arxii CBS 175.79]|uniref:Uncharacterized protein n=1 Tax=Aaosphaeria arxii CBS 175.79 TaxID=1450172 RepID=A0A6A5XPG1_9PLEO|nr:uncharacterized protein BU24DRAFT_423947 [Aaosphaeria arxii CBS 175.79]KAF2015032.1 hypothetical protein BU24DRAFT_423947 [Aaosphaeria arxii CBS 175.79]
MATTAQQQQKPQAAQQAAQQNAQPPPQDQQQPKTPAAPATVALDNLQAMMNLVLISTGRFLKEQQAGGGSGRMLFAMKRAVPAGEDRFHDSLDELENEIHQAQAVLRRDLAVLQADRKKREQAEAAERQRRAAESSAAKNTLPANPTQQPADAAATADKTQDATMTGTSEPEQAAAAEPTKQPEENPASPEKQMDDAPPTLDTSNAPSRDPLFDETPITADAADTGFDFDAEFGDLTGGDQVNGDIDMDGVGDMNFLAGLEDFAKDGGSSGVGDANASGGAGAGDSTADLDLDFAMPDLPDMNASTNTTDQPPPAAPKPADPAPAPTTAPDNNATTNDTNNNNNTNSMADTMEPTTIDNIDDLFDMDYENPEATQFDDAFFGFDE